jgi:hypothetical protein
MANSGTLFLKPINGLKVHAPTFPPSLTTSKKHTSAQPQYKPTIKNPKSKKLRHPHKSAEPNKSKNHKNKKQRQTNKINKNQNKET